MDSILTTIKKMLGIEEDYTQFDTDIIIHINTVLMILNDLGIGPDSGFTILTKDQKWSDFLGSKTNIEGIKTYMYLKVRLLFDPPTSSFVLESMNRSISELESRLMYQNEYVTPVVVIDPNGMTTTTTTVTTTTVETTTSVTNTPV